MDLHSIDGMRMRLMQLRNSKFIAAFFILLILCPVGLMACSTGSSANYILIVDTGPGGDYTRNFNPYNTSSVGNVQGVFYEPLLYTNLITGKVQPWLASAYKVASDLKSITFTIRPGVTWSDGKPFTSQDVVFTFNLLHQFPALDSNGDWNFLKSVTAPDDHTVVMDFKSPNSSLLYYVGSKTVIVPQHIWSTVKDPTKFSVPDPVGTGPYLLKSFSPQMISIVKNPHYWQPGKPEVQEVEFPSSTTNENIELRLYSDQTHWAGIPPQKVQQLYVDRDPTTHHYWFPAVDFTAFYTNLTKYPFNLLPVRQAISDALDRPFMSQVAEQGYEPAANPTGILPQQQKQYLDPAYAHLTFTHDPKKSAQLLESAGFHKGPDGFFVDKQGKKLQVSIDVANGFSDWVTLCQVAVQNLKEAGIDASVNALGFGDYVSRIQTGNFDLSLSGTFQEPSPYYTYNALLNSANTAPIGQMAASNYGRWKDPTTDKLLQQYVSTNNPTIQKQALYGLQKIMVNQLPGEIPLLFEVTWSEYNTTHFTGWPSPQNPYATSANYLNPDLEVILTNLKPIGSSG